MTHKPLAHPLYCIAHRGGDSLHTENTIGAFNDSLQLDIDAIEIDIWNVGDELLVTHDRRLGHTLPGYGRLNDFPPEQLLALEMSCGGRLARLEEVLKLVGDKVALNIELKGPNCAEPLAKALESYCRDNGNCYEQYVVSSFDHHQLFELKKSMPEVRRGVLTFGIPLDYAQCCDAIEAYSFHSGLTFVNKALVNDAKRRGLKVWVYTVNEIDDMQHLSEIGVDGVFTDYPQRVIDLNNVRHKT